MRATGDRTAFAESTARMLDHLRANDVDVDDTAVLSIGPALDIDPARDRFINHDAANALRAREERAPFTFPALS